MVGTRVQQKRAAVVLWRDGGIEVFHGFFARFRIGVLILLMRGRGHIGDVEIDQPVVVHVAQVCTHCGKCGVRQSEIHGVGERAVPVVAIKLVGFSVVVGDVDIGPAVVIKIPPGRRVTLRFTADSGGIGHIGEGAVVVVVKQVTTLAVGIFCDVEQIGREVDIQPAVAVVIAECGHHARIGDIETARVAQLLESAVALVDIKEIGRVEATEVEIETTVVVHVDKCRAAVPHALRAADAGLVRDIFEFVATQVSKETASGGFAHHEEVGATIAVKIADRDARSDRTHFAFLVEGAPHLGIVVMVFRPNAGLLGGKPGEHGFARRKSSGGKRLSADARV